MPGNQNIIDSPEKIAAEIDHKKLRDKRKASVHAGLDIVVMPSACDHSGAGINKTIKYKRKNKWKDSISREYPGDTFHNFLHYILPSSFSCKQYIILGPGKQPKSENIKNS